MADKEQDYRIFVGGLSWDVTERQLESAFGRFGKIIDCQFCRINNVGWHSRIYLGQAESVLLLIMTAALSDESVMLERDSGRPRGFGFLTFADRRAMEDAIKDMHGREFGDRVISVNKAQPKMGGEEPDHGYGSYTSGGRGGGGYGGDRSSGQDTCFKCGRPGHWARDCPSVGGGRGGRPFSPPRSRYGAPDGRGDRYAGDRDRYVDDRIDRGRYGDRDRYDSRDDRYGNRDRIPSDRYPPVVDRFPVDRYGAAERYPQNGYSRDRTYDRDGGPRGGGSDRYSGGAGGPARYDGRGYRERPAPYDRPRRGGRPPSMERY